MIEVFAFEGNLPIADSISWGAAALRDGERIWNPGSGRTCTEADVRRLVADGHLSELPTTLEVQARHSDRAMIVAVVRRDAGFAKFLEVDTGRIGGLVAHGRSNGFQTFVFSDLSAFDRYAATVIADLLHRVLFVADDDDQVRSELIQLGLTLDSGHPFLLATWVHISDHNEFIEALARANIRTDSARGEFEAAIAAFRGLESEYEIIYEGGVAEGGGMDLDVAASTFASLHHIHKQIVPTLEKDYPFLSRVFAPPRFQEFKAASAHIKFSSGPKGNSLGERVARIIELRAIQAALEGRAPDSIKSSPRFEQAVRSVIAPSPQTEVRHRPIGEEASIPVEASDVVPVETFRSEPIVLLGFQEDVKDRTHRIGIRVGPKAHIWVSTTDNGEGERPEGVEVLQEGNDFLFRPAVYTLERRVDSSRREHFFLLKMASLDAGGAMLTAFPSTIVAGSYVVDVEIAVRLASVDSLRVGGEADVQGLSGATLATAQGWLRTFLKGCHGRELDAARRDTSRWLEPVRTPRPTALHRLLVALDCFGGSAEISDIVAEVNRRFDVDVRTNNTRREALNNPLLLVLTGDLNRTMELTEYGRDVLRAYLRAGGATGLASSD